MFVGFLGFLLQDGHGPGSSKAPGDDHTTNNPGFALLTTLPPIASVSKF